METADILLYTFIGFIVLMILVAIVAFPKDKTAGRLEYNFQKGERDVIDGANRMIDILKRDLKKVNEPELILLINAIIDNLIYKKLQTFRILTVGHIRTRYNHTAKINRLVRKIERSIAANGTPAYSDYSSFCDAETLRLYKGLGDAYSEPGNSFTAVSTEPYDADLSSDCFFYVKVSDCIVPRFVYDEEGNSCIYIYPDRILYYEADEVFNCASIKDATIRLTTYSDGSIIKIKTSQGYFKIKIKNTESARKFTSALTSLKTYLEVKDCLSNTPIL